MYKYTCTVCNNEYDWHLNVKRKYCPSCAYDMKKERQLEYQRAKTKKQNNDDNFKNYAYDITNNFTVEQMLDIQKLVKSRNKSKIKFKDICKLYPRIQKQHLKDYCNRIIKGEKQTLYTEE